MHFYSNRGLQQTTISCKIGDCSDYMAVECVLSLACLFPGSALERYGLTALPAAVRIPQNACVPVLFAHGWNRWQISPIFQNEGLCPAE